jgi:Spy/CpxP family protein refolding chaperone
MKTKLLAAMVLTLTCPAWAADSPQAQAAPTQEEIVADFRNDLMARRADVIAKGLTLTSDQAAKFWPLFDAYQKEQDVIVNEQLEQVKAYADHFQSLSDEDALNYLNSLLTRDQKMLDLRRKWLAKFQKVVSAKTAARAIQIDRRLSIVTEIRMSQQVPLLPQAAQ